MNMKQILAFALLGFAANSISFGGASNPSQIHQQQHMKKDPCPFDETTLLGDWFNCILEDCKKTKTEDECRADWS